MIRHLTSLFLCSSLLLLITAEQALAYVGPAPSLTVIGTILGFLGLIVLAIFGFLWYPIKRLIAKRKQSVPVGTAPREQRAEEGGNPRVESTQK